MGKRSDKHNLSKDSGMFGLFRKREASIRLFISSGLTPVPAQYKPVPHDSHMDSEADNTRPSLTESIQQIQSILDTLKSQHSALLKAMQPSLPDKVLSSTAEEEESAEYQTPQSLTPKTRRSLRESMSTSFCDSPLEWFDATDTFDGPEEFVLEPAQDVPVFVGLEADSQSTSDNSSIDTNIDDLGPTAEVVTSSGGFKVLRRTQLPVPAFSDEGSLFTILKKNVGKVCVSHYRDH